MKVRLTSIGCLLTGDGPLRGPLGSWEQLGLRTGCDAIVERGDTPGDPWRLLWLGAPDDTIAPAHDVEIDLGGRLLLPGLIDSHTHAVFAGDRSGEFSRRMAGASYAEIAAEGGGILTTVKRTREATVDELVTSAATRLLQMAAHGVRVVEIKTGYGLDTASECKLLQATAALTEAFNGTIQIVATAMPAHAVPPEYKQSPARYVDLVCEEILPAMAAAGAPCSFVDVFVERGYFDVQAADRIWRTARALGWQLKAHVDEFADIGGVRWAVAAGATSVEHLLATTPQSVALLANSDTVGVCLPLTSLFLREGYAPMRALVDQGALVAIATDCNPGSAMSTNLALAMQVAMLNGRLSPMECMRGVTTVAAKALGNPGGYDGRLAVGQPFVASLLDTAHPDDLFYELGAPPRAVPLELPSSQLDLAF